MRRRSSIASGIRSAASLSETAPVERGHGASLGVGFEPHAQGAGERTLVVAVRGPQRGPGRRALPQRPRAAADRARTCATDAAPIYEGVARACRRRHRARSSPQPADSASGRRASPRRARRTSSSASANGIRVGLRRPPCALRVDHGPRVVGRRRARQIVGPCPHALTQLGRGAAVASRRVVLADRRPFGPARSPRPAATNRPTAATSARGSSPARSAGTRPGPRACTYRRRPAARPVPPCD